MFSTGGEPLGPPAIFSGPSIPPCPKTLNYIVPQTAAPKISYPTLSYFAMMKPNSELIFYALNRPSNVGEYSS